MHVTVLPKQYKNFSHTLAPENLYKKHNIVHACWFRTYFYVYIESRNHTLEQSEYKYKPYGPQAGSLWLIVHIADATRQGSFVWSPTVFTPPTRQFCRVSPTFDESALAVWISHYRTLRGRMYNRVLYWQLCMCLTSV